MKSWNEARNILCIRLDAMGDVLMTTPAMEALKEAIPGRKVTLLTSTQGKHIAESIPFIDDIISYSAPWLKASSDRIDPSIDFEMIHLLKERNFDAAVIFTVYSQNPLPSALLCFLSQIPLVAAYCRENPYGLLSNWIRETEPGEQLRHEVRRHLDLVKELGASGVNRPLVLKVDEEAKMSLLTKLSLLDIGHNPQEWILIHPGSTAESRRYPPEKFAEVADFFVRHNSLKVLFSGSQGEHELISQIQSRMQEKSINLGGILSLKEMTALVSMVPLLVSNNSGPVHMAAALGTPLVDLYALTNPQHTPWMVRNATLYKKVACHTCYKSICPEGHNECLRGITPFEVFQKGGELFRKSSSPQYDENAVNPLLLN